MIFDKLMIHKDDLYYFAEIKKSYGEIHPIRVNAHMTPHSVAVDDPTYILAVNDHEDRIEYAFFRFQEKEIAPSQGDALYECIFQGSGFSGALREMRHTTFSDNGYVFYLPMRAIIEAFEILEKYFDT